jgi:hypothetical protein
MSGGLAWAQEDIGSAQKRLLRMQAHQTSMHCGLRAIMSWVHHAISRMQKGMHSLLQTMRSTQMNECCMQRSRSNVTASKCSIPSAPEPVPSVRDLSDDMDVLKDPNHLQLLRDDLSDARDSDRDEHGYSPTLPRHCFSAFREQHHVNDVGIRLIDLRSARRQIDALARLARDERDVTGEFQPLFHAPAERRKYDVVEGLGLLGRSGHTGCIDGVARVQVVTRCGHWKVPWNPAREIRVPRYITAFRIPALLTR